MNNKQQGFYQDNQSYGFEYISSVPQQQLLTQVKKFQQILYKMNYKLPLTIFNISITTSPDENKQIQQDQEGQQIFKNKKQSFDEKKPSIGKFDQHYDGLVPLQNLVLKHQRNSDNILLPLDKISDFFPKRFLCVYNKFQENLFLKCDLTIIVKNIQKSIKLQLLKPIEVKNNHINNLVSSNNFITNCNSMINSNNKFTNINQSTNKNSSLIQKQPHNQSNLKSKCTNSLRQLNKRQIYSQKTINSRYRQSQIEEKTQKCLYIENNSKSKQVNIQHSILFKQKKLSFQVLTFFSNFQSGNLHIVYKDPSIQNIYYLFLSNDVNTHGYNQWFYFGVKLNQNLNHNLNHNVNQSLNPNLNHNLNHNINHNLNHHQQLRKFRFVIVNLSKDLKYEKDMKLLTLSKGIWHRKVNYIMYKNRFARFNGGCLTSLDFQYQFDHTNQPVYFALSYPYTFTRLLRFVKQIRTQQFKKLVVTIQSIGKSQLQNNIVAIKIQKGLKSTKSNGLLPIILIIARQHSSQTPSSFICQSLVRQLLNSQCSSCYLLQHFSIILIPMINPDGIIHGNSRTNIKGYDINRLWELSKYQKQTMESLIVNQYIDNLHKNRFIDYVIDLHSHSKDFGAFTYFCQRNQAINYFNYFFSRIPQVTYQKCRLNIDSDKKCTFRGQMYHRLGIKKCITIQTSFYGYKTKSNDQTYTQLKPFKIKNFQNIATGIIQALQQTQKIKFKYEKQKEIKKIIKELDAKIQQQNGTNGKFTQVDIGDSSDSDPQNQYLNMKERQQNGQNGQNLKKGSILSNKNEQKSYSQVKQHRQTQSKRIFEKPQILSSHNRSLQMISRPLMKIQQNSLNKVYQVPQKKRKKVYSTLIFPSSEKSCQTFESQVLPKRYPCSQRELQFRRTLRRGYRMTSYDNLYKHTIKKQIDRKKQSNEKQKDLKGQSNQTKSYVYPTAADIKLVYQKDLHQSLFRNSVKAKYMHQKLAKKIPKEMPQKTPNQKFNSLLFDKDSNILVGNKIQTLNFKK